MVKGFKWLIPILILALLFTSVVGVSCTPGMELRLLIYSIMCGIQVWVDGSYEGTLQFGQAWGACMLELLTTEGMHNIDFIIPGSILATTASSYGMEVTTSNIPDITLSYDGIIVHGSRYEMNLYSDTTVASGVVFSSLNGNGPYLGSNEPYLGSIVVEASDIPFEPHLLVYPVISCEPSSFTVMLNPNTACSNTVRVGNKGDVTLNYDLYDLVESVPYELKYDDGTDESMICWVEAGNNGYAVRFTPTSYPVSLKTARICLWDKGVSYDHEQFAVEVYNDDGGGGAPGTQLGATVYTTATNCGWCDVGISHLGITITSGDFYIIYKQLGAVGDCERLCLDTSSHYCNRSWDYSSHKWFLQTGQFGNYMIRCVVKVPEDCPWLDESPKSGSVESGNSDSITISINAVGLAPGNYEAQIIVTSNDPSNSPTTVPVSLLVNNPPNTLSSPVPANHAIDVDINTDLNWVGGDPDVGDYVTYDVYFGTSSIPPFAQTVGPYSADQTTITYIPCTLNYDTKYYWEIVATDTNEVSAMGSVWDFRVTDSKEGRKGDFDGDGDIDFYDFIQFVDAYGSEVGDPNYNVIGDFNDDGDIDFFDFIDFAGVYGT